MTINDFAKQQMTSDARRTNDSPALRGKLRPNDAQQMTMNEEALHQMTPPPVDPPRYGEKDH